MINRSLLGESLLDFVVVSDTHYIATASDQQLEMESRRQQAARSLYALQLVASISPSFVVHLGDLVQEFPESAGFEQSVQEALEQVRRCGLLPLHVAGNHDVGDKPDPTMPTDWVTPNSLARYHEQFGRSWYSWDDGGWHFVVLNSQIMNGDLPEEHEQRRWLEADLEGCVGGPVVIFLHLAPFLVRPDEPWLAHYDNIAEPARGWLLDLIERHDVRLLFAGHSHFQFVNKIAGATGYVCPSTSFIRPGFSEMFSSVAPPERGRDDIAKLGFFLVRLHDDGPRVHLIRTNGFEGIPDEDRRAVVTRLPADLPHSPLGVFTRHPLAPSGEVPVAWPSMIRQPMRNDYPLLACLELGARHLRVPASDLTDSVQRERLALLRESGVAVTGVWIWSANLDLAAGARDGAELLDSVEIQIPGALMPDPLLLRELTQALPVPLSISPLMPRDVVPGKQHARARVGFRIAELADLDEHLESNQVKLDRVVVRVDGGQSPWDVMHDVSDRFPLKSVDGIDWLVELATTDEREQSVRVSEALCAAALQPGCRLFLDPLMDLDRTMDATIGLLDRMSNPHPAFHVARLLNSLLFRDARLRVWEDHPQSGQARCLGLASATERYLLVIPENGGISLRDFVTGSTDGGDVQYFDLEHGTSQPMESVDGIKGPALFVFGQA